MLSSGHLFSNCIAVLKIREEINTVVSPSEEPSYRLHASKCPYTMAWIYEMLRHCTPSPLILPHSTTQKVKFINCEIPAGVTVYFNAWEVGSCVLNQINLPLACFHGHILWAFGLLGLLESGKIFFFVGQYLQTRGLSWPHLKKWPAKVGFQKVVLIPDHVEKATFFVDMETGFMTP